MVIFLVYILQLLLLILPRFFKIGSFVIYLKFIHCFQNIRVPSWVISSFPKSINLTNEAEEQLNNLGKAELKPVIQRILNDDPRSTYIKQRYSNQIYTFLMSDLHISCKFDDSANSVNVYRLSRATKLSDEAGNPQDKY